MGKRISTCDKSCEKGRNKMKKVYLGCLFVLLMIVLIFLPIGKEKKVVKQKTSESTSSTSSVVSLKTSEEDSSTRTEETCSTSEKENETKDKNGKTADMKIIKAFGEAYANYHSINERNEKLKKLMTAECQKKNAIYLKTAVQLSCVGNVTKIYQAEENQYAVLLDCNQNGRNVRFLLLATIKDGKISEMTYNTVKQEY